MKTDACLFIALLLCGYALYFIPLQSTSFYFDDRTSIVNNEAIKTIDIPKIFKAFNTRTLVGLSFALNYKFSGLNPFGYRLTDLLIHCLNSYLVYLLIKAALGTQWPAIFGSLLFLCHPIQTEAVNSITQRFVLMGSFFYLASLYLYINSVFARSEATKQSLKKIASSPSAPRNDTRRKFYYICSLMAAAAAMFCKEFTVTLPIMIFLYDFYFLDALAQPWWKRCRRIIPFFVIALIVPILLLRTPQEANGAANIANTKKGDSLNCPLLIDITRAKGSIGRRQYFLTELNVVCTYLRLLVLPVNQNLDYDYPLSRGLDAKTLFSGLFLLCILGLAGTTYRSHRIISFSILWFFIALSVESSVIPIGHVIAEYRLYLASVGFVLLVTTLVYSTRMELKKINTIAALILIVFSILSFQRNEIWKDEFTLWNDTVQKSPHKARAYNNRGLEYYHQGNFTQAIADFDRAIEINPNYAAAFNNRGVLYALKGDLSLALSDFDRAIEINPKYTDAYKNRALTIRHSEPKAKNLL